MQKGRRPANFAGSLLVAHPNLLDPNFRRSVLYVSAHDPEDGALGIIINRPLDRQVADLVSDSPPGGLGGVPVFLGGPVGNNQLMFAALEWQQGHLNLNHNVGLLEAGERLTSDPASIRAFVGYAGWGAGQLEAEMQQQSWVVQPATRATLRPERLPRLWFEIMSRLGPWYKMMAVAPDDPSLN